MIYTYGDSFSYRFWITEEETYTHVLSQKLNVDYVNKSFPALCHHETYQRLIDDLDGLQSGDLIVYQFTAGTREGYRINDIYYSSAGLTSSIEDSNKMIDEWGGGRKKYPITDDQMLLLWQYSSEWGQHTISHKYDRVFKLLKFLEKSIGIKFRLLFLDSSFDHLADEHSIKFGSTSSILDWITLEKLRLKDSDETNPMDDHPNAEAHQIIAEKIYESL